MLQMTQQQPLTFGVWLAGIITRWRLVLWVMAGTLVAAFIAVLVLPPVWQAHASFVTAGSTNSKMASALSGGGAGLQGIASQLGVAPSGDPSESPNFYVKLIQSEELRRRLLKSKFQDPRGRSPHDSATLLEILRPKSDDAQRRVELGIKTLGKDISTDFDLKTNLVQISVN